MAHMQSPPCMATPISTCRQYILSRWEYVSHISGVQSKKRQRACPWAQVLNQLLGHLAVKTFPCHPPFKIYPSCLATQDSTPSHEPLSHSSHTPATQPFATRGGGEGRGGGLPFKGTYTPIPETQNNVQKTLQPY